MKENFPDLVKEIDIQVQEAQRVPSTMDTKRPTPIYMIIKRPKVKDTETLKSSKRKEVTFHMIARWERGREREGEEVRG